MKLTSGYRILIFGIVCFTFLSITPIDQQITFELDTINPNSTANSFKSLAPKDWTFIVYVAADNDLRSFAARNIKQMSLVGSNNFINIVVHLDIKINGNKKITRRYYIEKDRILHVNADDQNSQKMDSGDPKTLISCCNWAIENYPANHYAIILWNHGTGIIDPDNGRIIHPAELFSFNPQLNKLELDRTISFLDFINGNDLPSPLTNHPENKNDSKFDEWWDKGLCWDDSTGNYLTNQKLQSALQEICTTLLHGRKIDILGFDACLMSMLEVANLAKNYAHIMVGSQEVELGAGWNYELVLKPFRLSTLSPKAFAENIVNVYHETYNKITNDFTQSAINLDVIEALETNVNTVSYLLMECLKKQVNNSVKNAIQASRSKLLCTHFDEPSYLDLHHLYSNIQSNLQYFILSDSYQTESLRSSLQKALEEGKKIINSTVLANTTGKNLSLAKGISIYFPERRIHSSYRKTLFASTNYWIHFMNQYLLL